MESWNAGDFDVLRGHCVAVFSGQQQHHSPHIHVRYQDEEAVYGIPDGDLLAGSIPPAKARLVQAWIEIHRDELMADWQLAVQGQQPFKIEPLR